MLVLFSEIKFLVGLLVNPGILLAILISYHFARVNLDPRILEDDWLTKGCPGFCNTEPGIEFEALGISEFWALVLFVILYPIGVALLPKKGSKMDFAYPEFVKCGLGMVLVVVGGVMFGLGNYATFGFIGFFVIMFLVGLVAELNSVLTDD